MPQDLNTTQQPAKPSPDVYAILVGINEYLPPNPLKGCVNDVKAFESWLRNNYTNSDQLHIKRLTDEDADNLPTREQIISSFDHFSAAKDQDICIFYFCGHGTNLSDPPPFLTDAGTNTVQALVCRDINPGNRYIVDKELSYLIWKATQSKPDLNFIAIMDCCHSGTITRDLGDDADGFLLRTFVTADKSPAIEGFAGFIDLNSGEGGYTLNEGFYTVKQGPHVQIGAALDTQTAAEIKVNGESRGSFTYALLKTIQQSQEKLSYGQLITAAKSMVKNLFTVDFKIRHEQTPVINLNGGYPVSYLEKLFLSNERSTDTSSFDLFYDAQYGWRIEAGLLAGINYGTSITVQFPGGSLILKVKQVNLLFSLLDGGDTLQKKGIQYKGLLSGLARAPLTLGFAKDINETIKQQLVDTVGRALHAEGISSFNAVQLSTDQAGMLELHINDSGQLYLTRTDDIAVIYGPVPFAKNEEAIQNFLSEMNRIGKWEYIKNLSNNLNATRTTDYLPDFKVSNGIGADGTYTFTDGQLEGPNELTYIGKKQPCFQLNIKNTGPVSLHISFAYLDADFGIYTDLFEPMQVEPGKDQWVVFKNEGNIIKLGNSKTATINEYLKLFISNKQPILLESIEQAASDRSIGSEEPYRDNIDGMWSAVTIEFVITPHAISSKD